MKDERYTLKLEGKDFRLVNKRLIGSIIGIIATIAIFAVVIYIKGV